MDDNILLEPRKAYFDSLKDKHLENVTNFFNELTNKSGVDIAKNIETIKNYRSTLKELEEQKKRLHSKKGGKTCLIIFSIISIIIAAILIVFSIYTPDNLPLYISIPVSVVLLAGSILSFVMIGTKINKIIKKNEEIIRRLNTQASEYQSEGYAEMASLNELYDWNMHIKLFHQTIPLVDFDEHFNLKRFQYLVDKFHFQAEKDNNTSIVFVQSGAILGNPFVIEVGRVMEMGIETYHGSRVVSYTVTRRDSNGKSYISTETETLHATVTKPKPFYHLDKWMHYGSEAAPKLNFLRRETEANSFGDKKYEKYVESFKNKLEKKQKSNIKFTPLTNTEFEASFNALDRDNEQEFRLLFTPLAQQNMLDILRNKLPYGDDFIFAKRGMLNSIRTSHSQNTNYNFNPLDFINFDYEDAKEKFIQFQTNYFQSLYFDFAPLLAIPLYQQMPTDEFIFDKEKCGYNVNPLEVEVLANSFDEKVFKPERASDDCQCILKSAFMYKEGKADRVNITAYSFEGIERVDYVAVRARNGSYYDVPVHWIEYIPVEATKPLEIQELDTNRVEMKRNLRNQKYLDYLNEISENGESVYQRGLYSFIPKEDLQYNADNLKDIIKKGE